MATARHEHTATLLPDGRVLVAGGYGSAETCRAPRCSILSRAHGPNRPAAGGAGVPYRHFAGEGKVLVAGGTGSSGGIATTALFNPSNGTWTVSSPMAYASFAHTATLLPNGTGADRGWLQLQLIPALPEPSCMTQPRRPGLRSQLNDGCPLFSYLDAVLQDGQVLVAGGEGSSG